MRDLAARWAMVAGLVAARAALADPEPKADHARADRLFTEGRTLAKAHRFAEACDRFAASDALERTFGTAVNLGDCAERDGHLGRAWQLYNDAARVAERGGTPDLAKFARDRADALAPRLSTVIVTLADPTPGTTVRIGDRDEPPAARIRALVDPGDIEVVVTAPGAPELRRTLHGAAGSVVTLDVPGAPTREAVEPRTPTSGVAPGLVTPGFVTPGFVTIDRFDARSRAGIDLAYLRPADPLDLGRATVLRFEAHARYVDPGSGLGGYLQVPLAYSHDTDLFGDPITVTDAGNIEIGGLLVRSLAAYDVAFAVHLGATLPTGETGTSERNAGNLASLIALPEIYGAEPAAFTVTSGASATWHRSKLSARLALGLDWNFVARDHPSGVGQAIHYDAAAGFDLGPIAIALEFANAALPRDRKSLHAAALSVRGDLGAVSLYGALVEPLGDDLASALDLSLIAGTEFTFR